MGAGDVGLANVASKVALSTNFLLRFNLRPMLSRAVRQPSYLHFFVCMFFSPLPFRRCVSLTTLTRSGRGQRYPSVLEVR